MINYIWNFISNIGVKDTLSHSQSRSLKIFNRNLFVVFVVANLLSTMAMFIHGYEAQESIFTQMILLLTGFIVFLYVLNAMGLMNISRVIFIVGAIWVHVLPYFYTHTPMLYPYILLNGLFIFMMIEVLILYIFDRENWGQAQFLFFFLFLISLLDYWYVPAFFGTETTAFERYFTLKSTLVLAMIALAFLSSVLRKVVGGLFDLNEKTMNSFEEKKSYLLKMEAELNEKIEFLNRQNKN
ncbi:MAG: hypothetical protein CFE21_16870 [Bacteroidetes bacterium B1(2017)]|nr:MAG: hypothetical protein CFE21_16870 [Bacteroidetes bacterium B1(2017)]